MPDIVISALAAGLFGGLGAAIGSILTSRLKLSRTFRTLVLVFCTVGAMSLSRVAVDRFILLPRYEASVEDAFRSTTLFRTIDKHYPGSAGKIRSSMMDFYHGRISEADLRATVLTEISDLRLKATPKASQTNTLALMTLSREQIVAVRRKSEVECDAFVTDGSTTTPLNDLLGPEFVSREQALLASLLEQTASSPAIWEPTVSDTEVQAMIAAASERAISALPSEQRPAAAARIEAGEPTLACARTLTLFDEFFALGSPKAAAAFQRYTVLNAHSSP